MDESKQQPEHQWFIFFSRLQDKREKYRKAKPYIYYPILGVILLAGVTINHFYDLLLDKITVAFHWSWIGGWVMTGLFYVLCILTMQRTSDALLAMNARDSITNIAKGTILDTNNSKYKPSIELLNRIQNGKTH
jgi:hypothetical protein